MATTVFQDAFTEAANTNLASHTPNTGTGWTEVEDTATTTLRVDAATDQMEAAAGGASARIVYTAQCSPALSGADYDVNWTISARPTGTDDFAGAIARWTDTSNFYWAGSRGSGQGFLIGKVVAGVRSALAATTSFVPAAGDIIKFELRGSTLKLYQNGTERLSVTDTDLSATGEPGFAMGNVGDLATDDINVNWAIDDFEVVDQNAPGGAKGFPVFQQPRRFVRQRF